MSNQWASTPQYRYLITYCFLRSSCDLQQSSVQLLAEMRRQLVFLNPNFCIHDVTLGEVNYLDIIIIVIIIIIIIFSYIT